MEKDNYLICNSKVDKPDELLQWCQKLESLMTPTISKYTENRKELWLKRKCNLAKIPVFNPGYQDERLFNFANQVVPNFDIGLLLKYDINGLIKPHGDHKVFKPHAAMININEPVYFHSADWGASESLVKKLEIGEIVYFNCKKKHWFLPLPRIRWSIILWHLKEEYLEVSNA